VARVAALSLADELVRGEEPGTLETKTLHPVVSVIRADAVLRYRSGRTLPINSHALAWSLIWFALRSHARRSAQAAAQTNAQSKFPSTSVKS
jgi:hypothetical protein